MSKLKEIQRIITEAIEQRPFTGDPQNLFDPINYLMSIGGKRMRPALYMLGYSLFNKQFEKAIPGALAIEVFHNFTLMHDDIMDQAPLRRGNATVHTKWNINTAILSGDVMLVEAYKLLCSIDHPKVKELIDLFNACAIKVCEGQQMDMNFENRKHVSLDEYYKMIELKTAVLLAYALKMGALQADAPLEDANHLFEYGRNVGIAFQLMDDYLDCFGASAEVGKQIGGDIIANKKTFLRIQAMELATNTHKEEILHWESLKQANEHEKVTAIQSIYFAYRLDEKILEAIDHYYQIAAQELEKVSVDFGLKADLYALMEGLKMRKN